MKRISRWGLALLSAALPITAVQSAEAVSSGDSSGTEDLTSYVLNLGAYLGFDLSQQPKAALTTTLLEATTTQLLSTSGLPFFTTMFDAFMGSSPINTLLAQFVPDTGSPLNAFANATFKNYNNPSSQGSLSSLSGIDQALSTGTNQSTYQSDPTNQAILNLLSTPSSSYCMDNRETIWTGGKVDGSPGTYPTCTFLFSTQVMNNVLGPYPDPQSFFSPTSLQPIISQLNANTLLGPLLYTTTPTSQGGAQSTGLPAQNQAQQAADFVRYVTGSALGLSLPTLKEYRSIFEDAMNFGKTVPLNAQVTAQARLSSYLLQLRTITAQTSVGLSNIYGMLSKRIPQQYSDSAPATSQALNEFTMATWRLFNPSGDANTQWLNQVNQATSESVQKEIVTLLAEINYQLYLTRQQQERLLLTNSTILMKIASINPPKLSSKPPPDPSS